MTQAWRLRAMRTSLAIRAKLRRARLQTGQANRPMIIPLGRLVRIVEAEERLAEIDRALAEAESR